MGRNFDAVVADVIGCVPPTLPELRDRLQWLINDARYKAPEQKHLSWVALEEMLTEEIGTPTEDWQWSIVEIVTRKDREHFDGEACEEE